MNDFFSGLTVTQVAIAVGLALPLIVALVTKSTASATVKGVTLAVLAGIGVVGSTLAGKDAPSTITFGFILSTFLPVFTAAVASYFGLLKNLDINAKIAPESGIG